MYVTVILPLNLDRVLTYSVSEPIRDSVVLGGRVAVPIGRKVYTAIVIDILLSPPIDDISYKEILSVVDKTAIIPPQQLELWKWISRYYISNLGSVMSRFLPKGFRIKGEIEQDGEIIYSSSREVNNYLIVKVVNSNSEEVKAQLGRKKKQIELYIDIIRMVQAEHLDSITVKELNSIGYSSDIVRKLAKEGVIEIVNRQGIISNSFNPTVINRNKEFKDIPLSDVEQEAFMQLKGYVDAKRVSLLFNNSCYSSKNVIFNVVKEHLLLGQNVLMLTPDLISCSTVVKLAKEQFGEDAIEYSSRLSEKTLFTSYNEIRTGVGKLVIGAPRAIGLPFPELGLIVVLSEHDRLHKVDTSPRFMARDSAIMLSTFYSCAVILESSTPSIESYYNAQQGKYALVAMTTNSGVSPDSKVTLINKFDIDRAGKKGSYNNSENRFLSKYLISQIESNIESEQITILYKNQLGYARYILCDNCGHVPLCDKCNIALYFNRNSATLMCSICDFSKPHIQYKCDKCDSDKVEYRGYGTENIGDTIKTLFPDARSMRFDREALKTPKAIRQAIEQIGSKEVDIVIGTGILLRDYQFDNIATSSIVDCDTILNSSDFRAEERCYQTSLFFLGCSKELVIQSTKIDYPIFKHILRRDYFAMYQEQLEARKAFLYPPFARLIQITIRHRDEMSVSVTTGALFDKLSTQIKRENITVSKPIIDRVKARYLMNITVKILHGDNISMIKSHIKKSLDYFINSKYFRGYVFNIDVDIQ